MYSKLDLNRFRGIAAVFGLEGLKKLNESHITIVGLGGVGSWCVESLARSGVGHLRIIDSDTIALHNSNRQIHTLSSTIGQTKTEALTKRLLDINPNLDLSAIPTFVTQQNLNELFPKENALSEFVVDAIDSIDSKIHLINHLKRNKYKFITSGGAGGKSDPSKIKYTDLKNVTQDPLLSKVRYKLKHDFGFNSSNKMGIKCVFVDQQIQYPKENNSQEDLNFLEPYYENSLVTFGAYTAVTASVGLRLSSEIIRNILEKNNGSI